MGIGTSNPQALLHVAEGTSGNGVILPGLTTQQNDTSPNVIGGFSGNSVGAAVVGATIGGGGNADVAQRLGALIPGVSSVIVPAGNSVNVPGLNSVNADYGTVGGGISNTAAGDASAVAGGLSNTAGGTVSTVGGGESNTAGGLTSTVGGGFDNTAGGARSTVGGGDVNTAGY